MLGLSHKGFNDRLLERYNMQFCSANNASIAKSEKLNKSQGPKKWFGMRIHEEICLRMCYWESNVCTNLNETEDQFCGENAR